MTQIVPDPQELARLTVLYQESARGVGVFIEWRSKVLSLSAATLALVFAAVSWAIKEDFSPFVLVPPLLLGAVVSLQCVRYEDRIEELLRHCYMAAADYEDRLRTIDALTSLPEGVWTKVHTDRDKKQQASGVRSRTFGRMVKLSYWLYFAFFVLGALAAILVGILN